MVNLLIQQLNNALTVDLLKIRTTAPRMRDTSTIQREDGGLRQ